MQAPFVAHNILETLVAAFTKLTGGRLDVLLCKRCGYVCRHKPILSHDVWLEPDSHTVVGAHHHRLAYTVDTLDNRDDVDCKIVLDKALRILVDFVIDVEHDKH